MECVAYLENGTPLYYVECCYMGEKYFFHPLCQDRMQTRGSNAPCRVPTYGCLFTDRKDGKLEKITMTSGTNQF